MNWRDNPDSTYYADWAKDYSDMKQVLAIDFDGVLYDRPKSEQGINDFSADEVPGAMHFLASVYRPFDVVIFSARFAGDDGEAPKNLACQWIFHQLELYNEGRTQRGKSTIDPLAIVNNLKFTATKPPAHVYLDDRAITFTGNWPSVEAIMKFKTWTERLQEL